MIKIKFIFQITPIILNAICTIFWMIGGRSGEVIAFLNLIINIAMPFYILTINHKNIAYSYTKKQKIYILIRMYIIIKLSQAIYYFNAYTFASMDLVGSAIHRALWIFNSIVLFVGWYILLPLPGKRN